MPKSFRISLLVLSVVLVLTVFVGANFARVSAATEQGGGAYKQMQVYSEVLRHVQTEYVEDPNMGAVTNGALRGLLETLDSNSSYLTPAEYKDYKAQKPGRAQVGLNVAKRFSYATVISVVPDSPADKAGLVDGDILESIADKTTRDLSLASITRMLQGDPGSTLVVSVVRRTKSAPDRLTMTRAVVATPGTMDSLYEQGSILYLKPEILDHDHVQQVEQKLKNMGRTSTKKVLLDLRDVSTGDDAEALRLANFFIKTGTLATLEGQKFPKQTFTAEANKCVNATAPMVTLVNRGTSGPAELVAGALADSKRSQLVGEKTFGDASTQKTFELADGAALILSIAKYETPSGKKLQDEGVTPDVLVASAQDATDSADDDDEDATTPPASTTTPGTTPGTVPKSGTDTTTKNKPALPPQEKSNVKIDEQLNKALDLLKARQA